MTHAALPEAPSITASSKLTYKASEVLVFLRCCLRALHAVSAAPAARHRQRPGSWRCFWAIRFLQLPIEPASFQYLSVAGVCRNGLKFESGRTHLFIDVPVEMPHLTSGAGARRTDPRAASMARARKARNSVKLRRRHWHLPHCSSDVCWRCMLREHGWEGAICRTKTKPGMQALLTSCCPGRLPRTQQD